MQSIVTSIRTYVSEDGRLRTREATPRDPEQALARSGERLVLVALADAGTPPTGLSEVWLPAAPGRTETSAETPLRRLADSGVSDS